MNLSRLSTFQATGTIRNVWSLAWPLMIGLVSSGFMIFCDRLLLARYSPLALNASATAGTSYYLLLVVPLSIAAISEVFVGRFYGESHFEKIGPAIWQMLWICLLSTPFFFLAAHFLPTVLFSYSESASLEKIFFKTLLFFAPISCTTVALSGFFIGIGKPKAVTYAMVIGNGANIILAIMLIFGFGPIPQMGMYGAALASGIAQLLQTAILLSVFLKKNYAHQCNTRTCCLDRTIIREAIQLGFPTGLGHVMETGAHVLFFQIIATRNATHMTLVAVLQSIYILSSFILEALSKSTTAITANLLGSGANKTFMRKTLFSASFLHIILWFCFSLLFLSFPSFSLSLMLGEQSAFILNDSSLSELFFRSSFWMCTFFFFDGINWILMGALTACCDTKYIFFVSTFTHWFLYALPAYLFISVFGYGPDVAWMIIACSSVIACCLYVYRYCSEKWQEHDFFKKTSTNENLTVEAQNSISFL